MVLFLYAFPSVWGDVGLRTQKDSAKYSPIDEARDFINPSASVIVIENNGKASLGPICGRGLVRRRLPVARIEK